MNTFEDRSVRYQAARFAWVRELMAMLDWAAGSPEWERQWQVAQQMEERYEAAKKEFLQAEGEDQPVARTHSRYSGEYENRIHRTRENGFRDGQKPGP